MHVCLMVVEVESVDRIQQAQQTLLLGCVTAWDMAGDNYGSTHQKQISRF